MEEKILNEEIPQVGGEQIVGKKVHAIPVPQKEIGIDLNNTLFQNIIFATEQAGSLASAVDMSSLSEMDTKSLNREQRFQLLDTMLQDSTISAVVETYTEDTTEYNDQGRIVWVESSNPDVASFVDFLLKSLKVEKNIYKWANCLIKYGDVYLRLYRKSEYEDRLFDELNIETEYADTDAKNNQPKKREIYYDDLYDDKNKTLNEQVYLKYYKNNDKFVPYLEMVPNPAEVFELTRFGKTAGYIKTNIPTAQYNTTAFNNQYMTYKFERGDVELFGAKEFVHACLEDASSRCPESVEIFLNNDTEDAKEANKSSYKTSYTVRGGESMLASAYKAWRELMLLQQSVMLNRVTQSSVIRAIGVEVGDMPKEMVGPHLRGIKNMIEQKAAILTGDNMSEYTNPGPIVNTIYIPKHEGVGAIDIQTIGGDPDVKGLADLDYFMNQMFGALRAPKQFFAQTDDGAGFNGGESLALISSRYAKAIKRLQNTLIQMLTDAVNILLLDRGLPNYVNKFKLKMQQPTTKEEKERREMVETKVRFVESVTGILSDVDDQILKLKITKALLSDAIQNTEVISLLQEQIDNLEKDNTEEVSDESSGMSEEDTDNMPLDLGGGPSMGGGEAPSGGEESTEEAPEEGGEEGGGELPSPADLGVDFTDNSQV